MLLLAGALAGLVAGLYFSRSSEAPSPPRFDTSVLLKQVQSLSELVTVKFHMEKVVIFEDVKWYGENRVLLVAHGIVKAGVDLSKATVTASPAGNSVTVTLPRPSITDVYLDDQKTQVIERNTGMLRNFDKDLEQNARRQAVDDIRRAARNAGIVKEATERAQSALSSVLQQSGFEKVEIKFE